MKLFKLFSYLLSLILLLLALAVGSENGQAVTLNLLVVKLEMPLAVLMYASFIVGLLTCLLFQLINKLTRKHH